MLYVGLLLGGILGSFITIIVFALAKEFFKENKSGIILASILKEHNDIREETLCIH